MANVTVWQTHLTNRQNRVKKKKKKEYTISIHQVRLLSCSRVITPVPWNVQTWPCVQLVCRCCDPKRQAPSSSGEENMLKLSWCLFIPQRYKALGLPEQAQRPDQVYRRCLYLSPWVEENRFRHSFNSAGLGYFSLQFQYLELPAQFLCWCDCWWWCFLLFCSGDLVDSLAVSWGGRLSISDRCKTT